MVVAPAQKMRVISWNLLHGQVIPPVGEQDWRQSLITSATDIASHFKPDFISLFEEELMRSTKLIKITLRWLIGRQVK